MVGPGHIGGPAELSRCLKTSLRQSFLLSANCLQAGPLGLVERRAERCRASQGNATLQDLQVWFLQSPVSSVDLAMCRSQAHLPSVSCDLTQVSLLGCT